MSFLCVLLGFMMVIGRLLWLEGPGSVDVGLRWTDSGYLGSLIF